MVKVVRQLSIFLENKPGVLASVASALASAKINLLGITVSDTVDHAVVRLVVSDPIRARDSFEEAGVLTIENDILAIRMSNRPGELARYARLLAQAKLNIEYVYASASGPRGGTLVYIRVDDVDRAAKILGGKKKKAGKKKTKKVATKKAKKKARKR